jgi:putative FmdB family regulatory protein
LYEYRCEKCGSKFEILRGISAADDDIKCPKCSAEKPTRLLSLVCGGRVEPGRGNLRFPT